MCVSIWLRGIAITHPTSLSPCPGNLCKTELHSNLTPQLPSFPQCAPACSVSLFQILLLLRAAPQFAICVVEVELGSINCFGGSARCGHELAPRWDQWQWGTEGRTHYGLTPGALLQRSPVRGSQAPTACVRAVFPWRWA